EPGTTVTVYDPEGNEIGTGTVGDDGTFEVTLDEPQTNGEELEVTLSDAAGNESDPAEVAAPDSTAPDAPVAGINEDGTIVSGTGEPGTTVTVYDPEGNEIGTGTVGDDGTFEVTLDEPQTNGEELEVTLSDAAGNESDPAEVAAPDSTAPDAPVAEINEDGTIVSGIGEPGTTVTVYDPEGNEIGTGTVGDDGTFEV